MGQAHCDDCHIILSIPRRAREEPHASFPLFTFPYTSPHDACHRLPVWINQAVPLPGWGFFVRFIPHPTYLTPTRCQSATYRNVVSSVPANELRPKGVFFKQDEPLHDVLFHAPHQSPCEDFIGYLGTVVTFSLSRRVVEQMKES